MLVLDRFSHADISVLLPDIQSSKDFAHEKHTKAPEGTTAAVAAGGTIGGTLGLLAGIAMAIPGLGPFIAAGPIMSALAGLGLGAVGGLTGALVGMGIPKYEAKRYEGRIRNGGVLLFGHCDTSDEITRAKDALKETGRAGRFLSGRNGRRHHRDGTDAQTRLDATGIARCVGEASSWLWNASVLRPRGARRSRRKPRGNPDRQVCETVHRGEAIETQREHAMAASRKGSANEEPRSHPADVARCQTGMGRLRRAQLGVAGLAHRPERSR
jgi:hypothetical protein